MRLMLPKFKHGVIVLFGTTQEHNAGWCQHHVAQAMVEYANRNPALRLQSITAEHFKSQAVEPANG